MVLSDDEVPTVQFSELFDGFKSLVCASNVLLMLSHLIGPVSGCGIGHDYYVTTPSRSMGNEKYLAFIDGEHGDDLRARHDSVNDKKIDMAGQPGNKVKGGPCLCQSRGRDLQ